MKDTLVTIATFEYSHFAYLAKAKLESKGINAVINDEYTATMNWLYTNAIGGIKLKVLSGDAEKALKILNENNLDENIEALRDEGFEIENDAIVCLYCKSTKIIDERYSKKWAYLSILLLGFPLLFKKRTFLCLDCKYRWKKEDKD